LRISPIVGLRGRTTFPRADESYDSYHGRKGEPSRRIEVSTSMHIREVAFRTPASGQFDFYAYLELSEEVTGNSGKDQNSGKSVITLRVPLMGKEVSLLTGLVNRKVQLTGEVPEKHWSYDQLQEAFFQLKAEYEDLVYRLEEASSLREGLNTVRKLA